MTGRALLTLARVVVTAVVLVAAALTLWRQWNAVDTRDIQLGAHPGPIVTGSLLVIGAYAVLIEAWRQALVAWDASLGFWRAARIWAVSNLGRYVPGKVWQLTAMAVMLQRAGVPLSIAGAAAITVTLVNVLAGLFLVVLFGPPVLVHAGISAAAGMTFLLIGALLLVLTPAALPVLLRTFGRVTGRKLPTFHVPARAVWVTALGSLIAWVVYGIAFREFARGLLGAAPGPVLAYVAVYAGSYLLGYLALFAPAGIGVRELALTTALPAFGLATAPEAALLTVASRLWLTILEVIPGAIWLLLPERH